MSALGPERRGPERPGPDYPPEWDDEYDDAADMHDALHPWLFAGCDDCTDRADWLERQPAMTRHRLDERVCNGCEADRKAAESA